MHPDDIQKKKSSNGNGRESDRFVNTYQITSDSLCVRLSSQKLMSIPILPDFLTNKNDIAEILTISFNLIFVVVLTNVGHCTVQIFSLSIWLAAKIGIILILGVQYAKVSVTYRGSYTRVPSTMLARSIIMYETRIITVQHKCCQITAYIILWSFCSNAWIYCEFERSKSRW